MITLFTGMPGAGKTAAMVDLLSKLDGTRPLYVHFDETAKLSPDHVLLGESLKLPHECIHAKDWPSAMPDGAILIIDEVQSIWRPRGPGVKATPDIEALELHRQRGIDIYITTQSPRLMDGNVRSLIGRHIHIRDTGILGRYWYEWPECNEGLFWKTCPVKMSFKLPKKAFDLYTSASIHTKPVRMIPPALYWAMAGIVLFLIMLFLVYKMISKRTNPEPDPATLPHKVQFVKSDRTDSNRSSGPIDDRTDFIPRVSNKPESAPAYDHLRVINSMPVVVGGYCDGEKCKCINNQGTDSGLSNNECRTFVEHPPFNPYRTADIAPAPGAGIGGQVPMAIQAHSQRQTETVVMPSSVAQL